MAVVDGSPLRDRLLPMIDVGRHGRIVFGALGALLIAGVAIYLAFDYRTFRRESEQRLTVTVGVAAEYVQQVVSIIDLTLNSIDEDPLAPNVVVSRSPDELHEILKRAQSSSLVLQGLGLTDATGHVIASAATANPSRADLSDRDFFQAQRDDRNPGLYIGRPVLARPQRVVAFPVSRRVVTLDGAFAGVIAARIDPRLFFPFFSAAEADTITVLRPDGVILTRHPEIDLVETAPVSQSPVLARARIEPRGTMTVRSTVEDVERIVAYRTLQDPAVVVVADFEASTINRAWLARTYPLLALLLALAAFLGVVGYLVQRHARSMNAALAETAAARAAAEQAADVKSTFLANMSHEIRTPLGGMLGYSDLLLKSGLGGKQMDWAIKLKSAGEQLLAVINDILDYSKLESGNFIVEPKSVPLASVVDEIHSMMVPQAHSRGLELTSTREPGLPEWVRVDPVRLKQILMNLVSNAIKFTDKGSVAIAIARTRMQGGKGAITFEVKDTGIGIPEAKLASVFERFIQADTKTSRGRGGTGLGLSISRRLAELMAGTLTLESTVGAGTTARLSLPLEATAAATPEAAAPAIGGRTGHILLVDDLPMNLEIAGAMLASQGHQVTTASRGVEAIDVAVAGRFDVILLDVNLPDLDGYEVAREIRKLEPPDRRTPILALTANALPEHIAQAMAAGMDGHISKPIDERHLARQIAAVLGDGSSDIPARPERALVDVQTAETLRRLLGGERLASLTRSFWQIWDRLSATLDDPTLDRRHLATETHDLVSHAGNVGYLRLADVARELSYRAAEETVGDLQPLIRRLREVAETTRTADETTRREDRA